jgi:SanA protein
VNRSAVPLRPPIEPPPRPRRQSRARRWFRRIALLASFAFVLGNLWTAFRARGRVFTNLNAVPATEVALVLGTSRQLQGGYENPFFAGRIAAAAESYRAGKARHLILSGDNRFVGNDEPTDMRRAIAQHGVPESATTLDYAGFRTLDSFARAKEVFGVTKLTIVTDDFHAARSVLLARHFGIDAVVFCSQPVPAKWSMKTRLREIGARCKALLDLYVLHTKPHFLGERVTLPSSSD